MAYTKKGVGSEHAGLEEATIWGVGGWPYVIAHL